jgi:uncharacterized protein DUF4325
MKGVGKMIETIDIGKDFYHSLTNRDHKQRDGKNTGVNFRATYLSALDTESAWKDDTLFIILDFVNVKKMGPSWANEVFAYFTQYASPKIILKKIQLKNISRVKKSIIVNELEGGHSRKFGIMA